MLTRKKHIWCHSFVYHLLHLTTLNDGRNTKNEYVNKMYLVTDYVCALCAQFLVLSKTKKTPAFDCICAAVPGTHHHHMCASASSIVLCVVSEIYTEKKIKPLICKFG